MWRTWNQKTLQHLFNTWNRKESFDLWLSLNHEFIVNFFSLIVERSYWNMKNEKIYCRFLLQIVNKVLYAFGLICYYILEVDLHERLIKALCF